jgi:predicted RNA-binding protein YlxR (DUF448 family)
MGTQERSVLTRVASTPDKEMIMSVEGKAKEAAGYIKEELNEGQDA